MFDFNVRIRGSRESRRFDLVEEEWLRWKLSNPDGLSEQFVAAALNFPSARRKTARPVVGAETFRFADKGHGLYRRRQEILRNVSPEGVGRWVLQKYVDHA
jgi:hypothetical protein